MYAPMCRFDHANRYSNGLSAMPALGEMKSLTNLQCNSNYFDAFPENIELLSALKTINLSGNAITFIPAGIGALHDLEVINLSNNKIAAIPHQVRLACRPLLSSPLRRVGTRSHLEQQQHHHSSRSRAVLFLPRRLHRVTSSRPCC